MQRIMVSAKNNFAQPRNCALRLKQVFLKSLFLSAKGLKSRNESLGIGMRQIGVGAHAV